MERAAGARSDRASATGGRLKVRAEGRPTILLVEDDEDITEVLCLVLSGLGYDVVTADDGAGALARLRREREPPRLILLDLMMPGMNGWEFRAEQMRDPRLRGIPVVVMTGIGDAENEAAAMGVDGLLAKPVDLDELKKSVARIAS